MLESPQKAVARRLVTIAALEKLLGEEKAKLRAQAADVLPDAGDVVAVRLDDGTLLGKVRADPGAAAGWRVTDAGALRAWVEENVPGGIVEQVTTVVDPDLIAELLTGIDTDAMADDAPLTVNPATGEVVPIPPGIGYVQAGAPKIVTTPDKGAPDALRARLAELGDGVHVLGITA